MSGNVATSNPEYSSFHINSLLSVTVGLISYGSYNSVKISRSESCINSQGLLYQDATLNVG